MGANMTEAAITRAAWSATLYDICEQFDKETNVPTLTTTRISATSLE